MVRPPYPIALRLYAIAAARWEEVDAAYTPLDLIRETPHRFCGLVYGWCVKHMDEERREQFDYDLSAPLPGREAAPPVEAVAEIEGNAFMAAMMQHQMMAGQGG